MSKEVYGMEFTGERFIPGLCDEELTSEHINRYRFAAAMVKGRRVLDIACGSGYGSMILRETAESVVGIDISKEAIDYCRATYHADSLRYCEGSVDHIPLENGSVDAVVSFETLEHVSEKTQRLFMKEVQRVLAPGGMLIISTPNKGIYDQRGENDFHVHELEPQAFSQLLMRHFKHVAVYGQMSEICNIIVTGSAKNSLVSEGPSVDSCEYLLAVCSDDVLPDAPRTALLRLDDPLRKLRAWASDNNRRIEELSAWGKGLDAQIAEKDATILALNQHNEELSSWGKGLDAQAAKKDATIRELNQQNEALRVWGKSQDEQIAERDTTIQRLNQQNEELSVWGKSQDAQIAERDATIKELNQQNEELSAWGKSQDAQIAERDATIQKLNRQNEELSTWGKNQDAQIAERDATIQKLNQHNEELSAWGKSQDVQIAERDATIQKLNQHNEELSAWGKKQDEEIAERDARIGMLEKQSSMLEERKKALEEKQCDAIAIVNRYRKENNELTCQKEELKRKMVERDSIIQKLYAQTEQIASWEKKMEEQTAQIALLSQMLQEQNRERNAEQQRVNELIESQKSEIQHHKGHVEALEKVVDERNNRLDALQRENNVLRQQVNYLSEREHYLDTRDQLLNEIEGSRAYRLCRTMQKTSGALLPPNSPQRKLIGKAARFACHPIQTVRNKKQQSHADENIPALLPAATYDELPLESSDMNDYAPISFPQWEKPMVSIVIPVYNQFGYTYACLKSILENTEDTTYEIIIANDCSNDLTSRMSEIIDGITVVTNETNLRFLKNCNHAATYAKGEYIFFLNNDTRVQKGWLSSLIDLIESDASIGMVGSKLVFCNGKLQEAGGIVFSDGNCWNYGRNDDPDAPAYNYVKEVDYISGAAIMIRSALWKEIGGFDEYFCPAYYEDTDLAFEVRKHGYKVVYQPKSVVIHYEGVSNGNSTSSGQKKYQVDNQVKFRKKWNKELQKQTDHDKLELFVARDRSMMKRHLLVVDHYVPTFDKDAGSRNIYLYLKTFAKMGYQVHFIGDNYAHEEPYTTLVQRMGVEVLYGSEMMFNWMNWLMDYGCYIGAALLHRPHISIKYIDAVKDMINGPVVYDVADLHRIRLMKEYSLNHDPNSLAEAKRLGDMEDYCIKKADLVYSVSVDECTYLNGSIGSNKAQACPIYVYEEFPLIDAADARKDLLFVGGFGHSPNQDAMRWFIKEVMPLIWKKLPDVKLNIVGSKVPKDLLALESKQVHFMGFVSDEELERMYQQSRIVVIPLRYGAGVKGKTIEAMYHGCAIVSTSTGLEGIENVSEIIQPKDDAKGFAEEVGRIYRNDSLIYDMGTRNQEYVKKVFGYDRAVEQFKRDFGLPECSTKERK